MVLEPFLLGETSDESILPLLRENNLAAYAYTCAPDASTVKAVFFPDYMQSVAHQLNCKARMLPLVKAWQSAEIEVLYFKGFYLAECVYDMPGQRFFRDVDVLIRPEQIPQASQVAQTLGWTESWNYQAVMQPYNHVAINLLSADRLVQIDVHRRILHSYTPWHRLQDWLTEQAWKTARSQDWEDTTIQVLQPLDSLIMGLILNRCWSLDLWTLKSHDLLDCRALLQKYALTRSMLLTRATELHCRRTVELFLERCDVWKKTLALQEPSVWKRSLWEMAIIPERGYLGIDRAFAKLYRPGTLQDLIRELPTVLKVRRHLHQGIDLAQLLVQLAATNDPPQSPQSPHRVARGVRWAIKLLGMSGQEAHDVSSLAIFATLRHMEYPAVFCQGFLTTPQAENFYSWVEIKGSIVSEPESDVAQKLSRSISVKLRYPSVSL